MTLRLVRLRVAFAAACLASFGAAVQAGSLEDLGRSISNSASNALGKSLDSALSGLNSNTQSQGNSPALPTSSDSSLQQKSQPANPQAKADKPALQSSGAGSIGKLGCGERRAGQGSNDSFHNTCGFKTYLLLQPRNGNGQCRLMGPISEGGSVPVPMTDPIRDVCVFRPEVMGAHARGSASCACPA